MPFRSVGGVVLRRQLRDRHVRHEVGVAQIARAVGERASGGLDDEVGARRRAESHRLQVVALEDVQLLEQADAARADRRHRDDVVAAIGAGERRALLRLIGLQVRPRDEAAVCRHVLLDEGGRLAFVESGRALVGDALQRPGQVGLLQDLARLVGRAVLRELRHRRRVGRHRLQRPPQRPRQPLGHREAVARQRDGRLDQPLPGQLPVLLPRQVQAGHGAGHADRQVAVVVEVGAVLPVLEEHRRRSPSPAPSRGSRTPAARRRPAGTR